MNDKKIGPQAFKKDSRRIRPSIKHDGINPTDFLKYKFPISCEECTHFHRGENRCTMEYNAKNHLHENQMHAYNLFGKVALCRFMEID